MKKTILVFLVLSVTACGVFLDNDLDSSPAGIFDSLWTSFNNTYALFEAREIDWNEIYDHYSPLVSQDMNDYELFLICAGMLNTLNDPHVSLFAPFGASHLLNPTVDTNDVFILEKVRNEYLVDTGKSGGNGKMRYGTIRSDKTHKNVGYIHFTDFHAGDSFSISQNEIKDWVNEIDNIINDFSNTDFLILDVRNTFGGFGLYMEYVASRFVSEERNYLMISTKNGPGRNDFSVPVTMTITPAETRYAKPIVLLTNQETVSAGEWFTLALKTQRHITQAGKETKGAFSTRVVRTLANGWKYTLSIQKVTDIYGINYEGTGISPNREHTLHNIDDSPRRNRDRQIEYALTLY